MKAFRLLFSLTLYAVLSLFVPGYAEEIRSFSSDITINRDSSIEVLESINVDFGTAQRHGIY